MKNFKKIVISLVLAMCLVFPLAACDGGKVPPTPGGGDGSGFVDVVREGTITISLPTADFNYEDTALKEVAKAYSEKYPAVTIDILPQTSSTYSSWLNSLFVGETVDTDTDIVQTITMSNSYLSKLVDYSDYLVKYNPYAPGGTETPVEWKDTLDVTAYQYSQDRSGIYSLNIFSNMALMFYNKTVWEDAGLVNTDGTHKIPATWDELTEMCAAIAAIGKTPLAVDGASTSYSTTTMSWFLNMYADQYFRDISQDAHAKIGDFCYDPDLDSTWVLDVNNKDNDAFDRYSYNPLRFLDMCRNNEAGYNQPRYKAMLTNLKKIIPTYTQPTFTQDNHYQAQEHFWTSKAAMTFATTQFFNVYQTYKNGPNGANLNFELGFFPAPPMTGEGDVKPAGDKLRSVGGAVGYYGIIKKDKKQNDLVADFMMYWASKQGQEKYIASMKEQGAFLSGPPLVKEVDIDAAVYPAKNYAFPGLCHNNPYGMAMGGVAANNGPLGSTLDLECQKLFKGEKPQSIDAFCSTMQTQLRSKIPDYISSMGWRANCLDDLSANPKK